MARLSDNSPSAEGIAESLDPQHMLVLRRMFAAAGARAPNVIWAPSDADFRSPMMQSFAAACRSLADPDGLLPLDAPSMSRFDEFRDWLAIVDCEGDGVRFRYREFGRAIVEATGRDMRGATIGDFDGPVPLFLSAVYRATCSRASWVFTEHEELDLPFISFWRRLIVPLADRQGMAKSFMVMVLPDNELRPGLAILPDPVFILDADRTIRFANEAAQELFGPLPMSAQGVSFTEATGVDLNLPGSPTDIAASRQVHDEVSLNLRDALVVEFDITVSAALLRGRAYYIVVLRVKLN